MSPDDTRPDAPGWYPDPAGGRMRRWDGAQWTGESRDMPPWAGSGAGAGRVRALRRTPKHWVVFGSVAAFLFLAVSYKALNSGVDLPPRTIDDAGFVSAANSTCKAQLQPLREARPKAGTPEGKDPGPDEKVAATVDDTADRLAALADDLRQLARQSPEEGELQAWLDEWDGYAAIGHQYADAVRKKDPGQRDLANDGEASRRRADLFAQANGLEDCTFA